MFGLNINGKYSPIVISSILAILMLLVGACGSRRPYVWVEELPQEKEEPGVFRIAVGDELRISVWGQPNISGEQTVRKDGYISVVLVGDLAVAGLTTQEAAREITKRLEGDIVQNVRVDVIVESAAPRYVTVVGEVTVQGKILLHPDDNLIDVIAQSNGFSDFAHKDQIYVLRVGANMQVVRFDFDRLTSCPKGGAHFQLQDGDIVIVD